MTDIITRHAREIERNLNRVNARKSGVDHSHRPSGFERAGSNGRIRDFGPASRSPRITAEDRKRLYRRLSRALAYARINRTPQAINEVHKLSEALRQLGIGE